MTTVFQITSRPILILSKCIGLIDISYIVEPTGLLVYNINSTCHVFLEIIRMIVLTICTFVYFKQFDQDVHIIQIIHIIQFWIVIIAARLSTIQIIKFINGIIEFDRKIKTLSKNLIIPQRLWKKKHWDITYISILAYFILFKFFQFYLLHPKIENIQILVHHAFFSSPYLMDYVVTISSCFFLQNIYVRFQMLNDIWKCLPADLVTVSNQWTYNEIVGAMENTRLLHSELCELLKMFTLGYGPLLLCFFTSSFICMLLSFYFFINIRSIIVIQSTKTDLSRIISLIVHVQIVMFLMSVTIFVSMINVKRLEIISYLRSYRISNLHLDIKRQIKMFMSQISACGSDQISAYGFFDINLNLVTTIIVLLISGIITLIQMKNHPLMLQLNNDTKSYLDKIYNEI
ncbi:uncharacterized protein LOC114127593 [Aphis gossypii]|uniref:uncharacterized protein LOC114127593 n=1 Tax=Aphis gossypii TaxID=80765 RepID=UPI002159A78E|nr:uncharacterized protein LOC114127593 [Aphis gossypii]